GLAHVNFVEGVLLRMQRKFPASEKSLREAWLFFDQSEEHSEAARTEFEIARTLLARGSKLAVSELVKVLESAEKCQRDVLVAEIECELKAADELEYYQHIFKRARGRHVIAG